MGLTAKTFGKSPALDYLGVADPAIAYALDEAIALRLVFDEIRSSKAAYKGSQKGGPIPLDRRYETAAEILEREAAEANERVH